VASPVSEASSETRESADATAPTQIRSTDTDPSQASFPSQARDTDPIQARDTDPGQADVAAPTQAAAALEFATHTENTATADLTPAPPGPGPTPAPPGPGPTPAPPGPIHAPDPITTEDLTETTEAAAVATSD
jgi:hypothetical protein